MRAPGSCYSRYDETFVVALVIELARPSSQSSGGNSSNSDEAEEDAAHQGAPPEPPQSRMPGRGRHTSIRDGTGDGEQGSLSAGGRCSSTPIYVPVPLHLRVQSSPALEYMEAASPPGWPAESSPQPDGGAFLRKGGGGTGRRAVSLIAELGSSAPELGRGMDGPLQWYQSPAYAPSSPQYARAPGVSLAGSDSDESGGVAPPSGSRRTRSAELMPAGRAPTIRDCRGLVKDLRAIPLTVPRRGGRAPVPGSPTPGSPLSGPQLPPSPPPGPPPVRGPRRGSLPLIGQTLSVVSEGPEGSRRHRKRGSLPEKGTTTGGDSRSSSFSSAASLGGSSPPGDAPEGRLREVICAGSAPAGGGAFASPMGEELDEAPTRRLSTQRERSSVRRSQTALSLNDSFFSVGEAANASNPSTGRPITQTRSAGLLQTSAMNSTFPQDPARDRDRAGSRRFGARLVRWTSKLLPARLFRTEPLEPEPLSLRGFRRVAVEPTPPRSVSAAIAAPRGASRA